MAKGNNLEKLISERLISEGSSAVYFSLNPAVTSNELWTRENGLEKSISANKPGEAVTLIGRAEGEKGKESYFLHSVYEIIPFSSKPKVRKEEDKDTFKKVYESMIPGVAYINPLSIGINNEDFNNLDKETGPVKRGNKEFLGVVNLDYLVGLKKGKINAYFRNGAYLIRNPSKENKPTSNYKILDNIGQGAGIISSKITNKIADAYGFPRPKPGDIVVGVGYFEDTIINSKMDKKQPYAFSMVVSAIGDRVQVPPDVIDSLYIEVILGVENKLGKKLV